MPAYSVTRQLFHSPRNHDPNPTNNDDQLRLARTQTLERRLVTEHDLTGLHHKRKARVDGVGRLLGLLWCHCVRLCNLGRVGWAVVDF